MAKWVSDRLTDLDPRLAKVKPERQFLASEHVRVLRLVERPLELVQLVRRERRSTSTNLPRLVVVDASAVHHPRLLLLRLLGHAAVVVAIAAVAMAIVVRLRDVTDAVEVIAVEML